MKFNIIIQGLSYLPQPLNTIFICECCGVWGGDEIQIKTNCHFCNRDHSDYRCSECLVYKLVCYMCHNYAFTIPEIDFEYYLRFYYK